MPLLRQEISPYKVPPMPCDYTPESAYWFVRYDALSMHHSSGILATCARHRYWTPVCNHESNGTSPYTRIDYTHLVCDGNRKHNGNHIS